MKKFLLSFIVVITLFVFNNVNATTNQYIEFESGENDDNAIYLETYEDYLNALKGVDEQELYKEEYLYMKEQNIKNYDSIEVPEILEAIVLEVEPTKEEYYMSDYEISKTVYQPIKIQIMEGEHKNEIFETYYILNIDINENIKVKPIKQNDRINVVLYEEEGETFAYLTTIDSSVKRINKSIIMLIITIAIVFICLGNKAFKAIPHLILLADLILIIFVPEMIIGRSIIWMSIVTILAYVIVDSAIKVGVNAKMFASILTTISVLLVTTVGLIIFNNLTNMSGIICEATSIIDIFPKGTIDFYNLNLALYMLMATIVISDIACKTIKTNIDKQEEIKEYITNKIPTVSGILLVSAMPKYLYLSISKYTIDELLNSEILTNEIVRILFLIIAMTVTMQVGEIVKKLFVEEKKK